MLKIDRAVIVEGRYDKIRLASVLSGVIVETGGFAVFKDKEKQKFIRMLAERQGIVVLTDSDSAGFKIRSFISGMIPAERITHVYIPDIFGKERRKLHASKEGKLGVEGIPQEILLEAFRKAGITAEECEAKPAGRLITVTDLYEDGLSGGEDSVQKRKKLTDALSLPERLSTSSLVKVLNSFMSYDEYKAEIKRIFGE